MPVSNPIRNQHGETILSPKNTFSFLVLLALVVSVISINTTTALAAPVPGTYYTLKAVHSGKCLDVQAPNTADGSKIGQYTCNGNSWQNWSLVDKGSAVILDKTFIGKLT